MHADEMTSLFMKNKIITPEISFLIRNNGKAIGRGKGFRKRLRLLLK